jgi:hypothetical protein
MFAAVVNAVGEPFYVRLAPEVAEHLREGEAVRVGFDAEPWLKPADKIIARFAAENGGVYDPVRHQRALETLHRPQPGTPVPTPAERVAANVRRLERLARYRLATRLADGRWQVPTDLVTALEARERTHPRQRLRVESVAERERIELGRAMSQQLGVSFVSDPTAFKGRVVASPATPSGRDFVALVDHQRRELTLVPKSPELAHAMERTVSISRDREGRLTVHFGSEMSR